MHKRVLILGAAGMLGHKLAQRLHQRFETWSSMRSWNPEFQRFHIWDPRHVVMGVDALQMNTVQAAIAAARPNVVINCIGIIKQRPAATDPVAALAVNALFPQQLAAMCQAANIRLIHVSTDCVFSGARGQYTESDAPDASDLYGRSKALGEVSGKGCLTLRTSIIGRELNSQHGLVEWFLSQSCTSVRGYQHAIFSGLTTIALSDVIASVIENYPDLEGLYHVSSEPISKFDLLQRLKTAFNLSVHIEPHEEVRVERSLDSSRFRTACQISIPDWESMIQEMATDPTPYDSQRSHPVRTSAASRTTIAHVDNSARNGIHANRHFDGKRVLITGGTGSLGQTIVRRLLAGEMGKPAKIIVFSRDEAKQHYMRLSYLHRKAATDEVIYHNFQELLTFRVGDIRDYPSVLSAVREADVVIHAAALKQVPSCEYFPFQAVQTNIIGANNLVRVIRENDTPVRVVAGISTDKACKPINVMGMTKALLERLFVEANINQTNTRFVCVRYGNVIASRGSVVPLFLEQIASGGPVTVTMKEMTRFLLSLDQAVDTVFDAIRYGSPGETFVPQAPSALVLDIARAMIDGRDIPIRFTGIRPGEKIHEVMVSEEEVYRTTERNGYFVIAPMLPEVNGLLVGEPALFREFSSEDVTLTHEQIRELLAPHIHSFQTADAPA